MVSWIRYLLIFIIILLGLGASILLIPTPCHDALGCLRVDSGAPAEIGVGVLTSGEGRAESLEVYQAARLAAADLSQKGDVPLTVQPFYGACLPGDQGKSPIEMAAVNRLVLVLGPTCSEDSSGFTDRMARSGKAVLSPLSWALAGNADAPGVSPSIDELASQSVRFLESLPYSELAILSSGEPQSKAFSDRVCKDFGQGSRHCSLFQEGQDLPQDLLVDAVIQVNLGDSILPGRAWQDLWPGKPRVQITTSRPVLGYPPQHWDYWIAPRIWASSANISQRYQSAYSAQMTSLAGIATYESIRLIQQSLQLSSTLQRDGTWDIRRQAFNSKLKGSALQINPVYANCSFAGAGCVTLQLGLYQLDGNEYRMTNP